MPRWTQQVIKKVKKCALERNIRFTNKALHELYLLELGLDESDIIELLLDLKAHELKHRIRSTLTGEWLYVFNFKISGVIIYLKIVLRESCIIVSFHEDKYE